MKVKNGKDKIYKHQTLYSWDFEVVGAKMQILGTHETAPFRKEQFSIA